MRGEGEGGEGAQVETGNRPEMKRRVSYMLTVIITARLGAEGHVRTLQG